MKHTFTTKDNRGFCGDAYCRGNCGTVRHTCTCGFSYIGEKRDIAYEVAHVLKEKGWYGG